MLLDTPDWAIRHNYFHHSNPRSKDRAKNIFEKVHVRPQVRWAKDILRTDDASEIDYIKAKVILDTFTKNRGSAAMAAGRAVQDACDLHLIPDDEFGQTLSVNEAALVAQDTLRKYQPITYAVELANADKAKQEKYIEEIPQVVEHAIMGLREAMAGDNRIIGETEYLECLANCELPHNTLPDYGRRGDLKTKWSRMTKNKKGETTWAKASLPSSLSGMFDMNNVYQVAGFYACNGRQPPFLVYANAYDYKVFDQNNTPELKPDFLEDVIRDIAMQHKITENILRAADCKEDLLGLVSPDFNAIYWQEPPEYIAEAKNIWGL